MNDLRCFLPTAKTRARVQPVKIRAYARALANRNRRAAVLLAEYEAKRGDEKRAPTRLVAHRERRRYVAASADFRPNFDSTFCNKKLVRCGCRRANKRRAPTLP